MAVRNESVRLSLQDDFTSGMARAATTTALLNKNLNDLNGTSVDTERSVTRSSKGIDGLDASARRADPAINKLSGRLRLLSEVAAVLGPALIPLGGVGVAAVAGLASSLSVAAIAGGSAVVAFQGVGDAVKAMSEAKLDPTVENLEKARDALAALGPDAARFVTEFQAFRPVLTDIRDAAAAGWFPGLTASLEDFERLAPKVEALFQAVGRASGEAIAAGAESLASERWAPFFDFLADEAPQVITQLASIVGDLSHGLAEMWMSFDPGNDAFLSFLTDVADGFDRWASSAAGREDIESFLAYVRESGPAVADAFGSLVNMLVQVTQAAAPLGGPVLNAISAVADVVAAIADSSLGTPIFTTLAAMSLLTRATTLWGTASTKSAAKFVAGQTAAAGAAGRTQASFAGMARSVGVAALAFGAINDSNEILDSLGRSGDAAKATAGNYQELADALSASNVGKYAADLGIDVARLAEDLYANGESGAYASQVMRQLKEDSHGLGAALNGMVGGVLPFYTAGADKAYDANKDLGAIIKGNTDLLGAGADATQQAGTATQLFSRAAEFAAQASRREAAALRDSVDAMHAKRQAALGAFDAETQYREALKAARAQGEKNNAGIRGNSAAALENRGVISSLASAWNNQSDAVKNTQGNFKDARSAFLEVADAMNVPKKRAKELADQLLDIPKSTVVKVEAENAAALAAIAETQRRLAAFNGTTATAYMTTYRQTIDRGVGPAYRANGGQVFGPGGPTDDRVPAMLSNKEYVIRAAAVERYGVDFFHRANAMRLASGGAPTRPGGDRGGSGGDGVPNSLERQLRMFEKALKSSEKALDRERSQRDALADRRGQLESGIRGGLTADLWDTSQVSPWGGSAAPSSPTDILRQQTAEAREFTKLIRKLKSSGLDGAALAEVIGSGDIERARMMASLSTRDLKAFESAYNTNQRALQVAGNAGGAAQFGAAQRDQLKELQGVRAETRDLRGDVRRVEQAIKAKEKADKKNRDDNADRSDRRQRRGASRGARNRRNG